jgi:hypothetical protein
MEPEDVSRMLFLLAELKDAVRVIGALLFVLIMGKFIKTIFLLWINYKE